MSSVSLETGTGSEISCKFEWEIPNFSSHKAKNSILRSPVFHASNATWLIKIYPKGQVTEDSVGYVSLFLYKVSGEGSVHYNFSFGIKTVNHTIVQKRKTIYEDPNRGWAKYMKRSEVLLRKSELVPSDVLTIVCFVELESASPDLAKGHSKLAQDFRNLYSSKENADVTLNVKGTTFSVHKAVLAARSSVFAAMFRNEMAEKKTGVVNINDCDEKAFDAFLLFLYSGELDFSKCSVCKLYIISDKYDIPELKLLCINLMTKGLSVENFGEILILCDQFDENVLLAEVQRFFNENFEVIVSSKTWETLLKLNFRLANNLLKGMAPKIKIVE